MTITSQETGGMFSGTGHTLEIPNLRWIASGTVSGSAFTLQIDYLDPPPGVSTYSASFTGTILPDGKLSGSGVSTVNERGNLVTISGAATPISGNQPPVAAFTVTPEFPIIGDPVIFDASSSTDDGDVTKLSYQWIFQDGVYNGQKITHPFNRVDWYTVKLTVTDEGGLTNSITKSIDVRPSVTIDGPKSIVVASNSKNSPPAIFTATVNPPGGSYSWGVIHGQEKVTGNQKGKKSDTYTLTANSESSSPNDVAIKVVYTYKTHINEATYDLTVQKPSYLDLYAIEISPPNYNKKNEFIGYETVYSLQVMDQWHQDPILVKGMRFTESVNLVYSNDPWILKHRGVEQGRPGRTNNIGVFDDVLAPFPQSLNRPTLPINARSYAEQKTTVLGWQMPIRCQIHTYSGSISQEGACPGPFTP